METRGLSLISFDKEILENRLRSFFDPTVSNDAMFAISPELMGKYSRYNGMDDRARILAKMDFSEEQIKKFYFKPFDNRFRYADAQRPLWSEPSTALTSQAWEGNSFLVTRTHGVKKSEGFPIYFTKSVFERDVISGHARAIPFFRGYPKQAKTSQQSLYTDIDDQVSADLSEAARIYLQSLGFTDIDDDRETASLIWYHA